MAQKTLSYKVSPSNFAAYRGTLTAQAFSFRDQANMAFQARGDGAVVSCYNSGSVVIQGVNADAVAASLGLSAGSPTPARASASKARPRPSTADRPSEAAAPSDADTSSDEPPTSGAESGGRAREFERWRQALADDQSPAPTAWIGIDEAGKGDFFGPLVIAAVRVETKDLAWLAALGVGDSKQLNDKNIRPMAQQLKKALPNHVLRLMPEKYNELYARFGNLNRLLAWAHAACAENVLEKAPAELILSDQFTKDLAVPRFFKGPGKACRYTQRTKAESDAAVAAASVLARAEFLWGMHELSERFGVTLHKGAGDPTIADARRFFARFGADELTTVAKTHFKTMETIGARK